MLVGSWRALARGLVFAASLVAPTLGLAQPQPQGAAYAAAPFAFQRLDIDQSGLQPVVCLRFTGALRGEGVRYSDYLAIAPDPRPDLRVEGQALCLTGLSYGSAYEIDLRQGLPGRLVGQAGKTPHHTNAQKQEMTMTDENFQLAQNSSGGQFGKYTQRVNDFKFFFSDDPVNVAALKNRGFRGSPNHKKWNSDDLVALYNNNSTGGFFWALRAMFVDAKGGTGDKFAIEALRELAPDRCNRDFQCFRRIFNEAQEKIKNGRSAINSVMPNEVHEAVVMLRDASVTLAENEKITHGLERDIIPSLKRSGLSLVA